MVNTWTPNVQNELVRHRQARVRLLMSAPPPDSRAAIAAVTPAMVRRAGRQAWMEGQSAARTWSRGLNRALQGR